MAGPISDESKEISLLDFWRSILSDWKLVLAITAIFAAISVLVALLLTPIYRAEVIVVETGEAANTLSTTAVLGQLGGLASMAGVDLSRLRGPGSSSRPVLHSRKVVEDFIVTNELLPVLYADQGDVGDPETGPTLWEAVELFTEEIRSIREDAAAGTIHVSIDWTDPVTAAEWANAFVAFVNNAIRQRDLSDAERNMAYLNDELVRTNVVDLQRVLYNLIETEMKTVMLANAREQYAFTVVDPAVPPEKRAFPQRALMVVLGTAIGGFIALLVVLLRLASRRSDSGRTA